MLYTSLFYECNGNEHASPAIGILLPAPLQLQFISHFSTSWHYIPATSHMGTLKRVMTTDISYQMKTYKAIPKQGVHFLNCEGAGRERGLGGSAPEAAE